MRNSGTVRTTVTQSKIATINGFDCPPMSHDYDEPFSDFFSGRVATGESFRLGDKVDVRLTEVNPAAGALRFEMLSGGRFSASLARAGRKHGVKAKGRFAKASVKRTKQSTKNRRSPSTENDGRA